MTKHRWRSWAIAVLLCCAATGSVAQANCNPDQQKMFTDTVARAKGLVLSAAVAVGDTPDYYRWFGTYSPANGEKVRANLKSIMSVIRDGRLQAVCQTTSDDGCDDGEYAWVYTDTPDRIHLCPRFFGLPGMATLTPGDARSDHGTREGALIHEISHFMIAAGTDDHCYSRPVCTDMAKNDATRAVDNADSYQYYAEDVSYYARQPLANKPAPADGAD